MNGIAAAASANKAIPYTYLGNKGATLRRGLRRHGGRGQRPIPIDTHDLPGYAAAMFGRYRTDKGVQMINTLVWFSGSG